jgi:ABC-type transport system substrate-binding protein
MASRPPLAARGIGRRPAAATVALVLMLTATTMPGYAQPADGPATLRVAVGAGAATIEGAFINDPAIFSPAFLSRCCLARTLLAYPGLPTLEGGTILHPDLAAGEPDVSSDGLLWTFNLRPDVRYQPPFDDRTVVAADIIRAIERNVRISPELAGPEGGLEDLDGAPAFARGEAEVISGLRSSDPMSLSFRLTRPDGAFGHILTSIVTAPIPEGAADGYDPVLASPDPQSPLLPPEVKPTPFGPRWVSTGPYMFETYPAEVSDNSLTIVRNPSWDPATDPLRRPSVEQIEVVTQPSKEVAFDALERGEVDIVAQLADATQVAHYKGDPTLAPRLHETAIEVLMFVPMNLAVPPFDDVAVRRAVNAVMDRAALRDAHLDGRATMNGFRGTADVAGHVFADTVTAGMLVTYAPFPSTGGRGDPEKARAEMRQSRYDSDHDGICDAAACSGVVIAAAWPSSGEVVRDGLAQLGIEAVVTEVTPESDMSFPGNRTAMQVNWYQWDYGLQGDLELLLRGGARLEGPDGTQNQSLVGATPEQLNAWGFEVTKVPSVDGFLDDCEREMGHRRAACWARLDQVVSQVVVPWVPIYSHTAPWLVSPRVASTSLDQAAFFAFPALDRTVLADES